MMGDEGRFDGPATSWLTIPCRGSVGTARGLSDRPNEGAESTLADNVVDIEPDPLCFAVCVLVEVPATLLDVGTVPRPSNPNGRGGAVLAFF